MKSKLIPMTNCHYISPNNRLDGQPCDSHPSEAPSHDRPLAHPGATYASTVRRPPDQAAGGAPTGKPEAQHQPVLGVESYAEVLKRQGGPQDTCAIMEELLGSKGIVWHHCLSSRTVQTPAAGR